MKKTLLFSVFCCLFSSIAWGQPPCAYDNSVIDGTVTMPNTNAAGTDGGILPGDMLQFNGLIVGETYLISFCSGSIPGALPGTNFDTEITIFEGNNIGGAAIFSNEDGGCGVGTEAEVSFTYMGASGNIDILFTNNDTGLGGAGACSDGCAACTAATVGFQCTSCPANAPMPPPCPYDNPTEADPGDNTVNFPSGPAAGTKCCVSPGEFILFCNLIDGESYTITTCATTVPGLIQGGFDPEFTLYTPGGGMVIASNGNAPGCGNAAEITFTWDSALYGGNCAELLVDNGEALNGGPCSNNWTGTIRAEIGYVCNTCAPPPAGPPCPYDNTFIGVQAMPFTNAPGEECCIHPGEYMEFCGLQTGKSYTITTCASTFPAPIAATPGSFDPQITIFDQGGGSVITSNDDLAGCAPAAEVTFTWTGANGGCVDVLMDNGEAAFGGSCSHNWNSVLRATLGFACNDCPPPSPGMENEDCIIADLVCTSGPITFNSSGPGIDDFAPAANQFGCLDATAPEHQSAWYYFAFSDAMPANSSIEFELDPGAGTGADFDFAVWGPDVTCDALGAPIRCSGASPDCTECPSTGVGMGAVDLVEIGGCGDPINCIGCSGPCDGFVAPILVQPGEGYYLLIDNWLGDSQGFTLTWSGTAANFLDCSTQVPCGITTDAGMDETLCGGASSMLNGSVTGASGGESYTWTGDQPGSTGYLSNASIANPTLTIPTDFSGQITYTLTVTDGGCTHFDEVVITVDAAGEAGMDGTANPCPGSSSINLIDFLGGSPDAGGTWSPALAGSDQGTFDPNSNAPGTYTYTVSPGGNCPDVTADVIVTVNGPTAAISGANTLCTGETITIAASGGTGYQWDDSGMSTTNSIDVTEGGTYNVTVTDGNGCTDTESITITENTPPSPMISGATSFCTGGFYDIRCRRSCKLSMGWRE